MRLQTMSQLNQLINLLEVFMDDRYTMRTSKALAEAAESTVYEAEDMAQTLGLTRKRRRRDGATLWVKPQDTAAAAATSCAQPCIDALKSTLRDPRFRARSFRALQQATGLDEQAIRAQLPSIGARVNRGGFVTLQ